MTKEELLEQLKKYCEGKSNTEKVEISVLNLNRIIKALEQDQCEDCIRRSDIGLTDFEIVMCNGDYREGLKILLEKIAAAPSVTPAPKIGHWIKCIDDNDISYYLCSACRCGEDFKFDFCPNCGSKNSE